MGQRGNTELVAHGIQNEGSHIRAHVCPIAKRVYVYPTVRGLDAIESGRYRSVDAHQPGIETATAKGYLVPPFEIPECVSMSLAPRVWEHLQFSKDDTLGAKGKKAEKLVLGMIRRGMFPIPALADGITDKDIQIRGADIIIKGAGLSQEDIVIQVKCDFPGGERDVGGTGNLYLQIAECNPFSIH